jgi:hypothetical protein
MKGRGGKAIPTLENFCNNKIAVCFFFGQAVKVATTS